MKKNQKNRELVTAQLMNQNIPVEGYCNNNYSKDGSNVQCMGGYSCSTSGNTVSSVAEDDDVLL